MEEAPDPAWLLTPVQYRPKAGQTCYLLEARKERCCDCSTGTRFISLWVTARGRAEMVSWCGHCFNATCDPHPLTEANRVRLEALREALPNADRTPAWPAVRPALEDLERQGLL